MSFQSFSPPSLTSKHASSGRYCSPEEDVRGTTGVRESWGGGGERVKLEIYDTKKAQNNSVG